MALPIFFCASMVVLSTSPRPLSFRFVFQNGSFAYSGGIEERQSPVDGAGSAPLEGGVSWLVCF